MRITDSYFFFNQVTHCVLRFLAGPKFFTKAFSNEISLLVKNFESASAPKVSRRNWQIAKPLV